MSSGPTLSVETTLFGALAANSFATTTSVGRCSVHFAAFALAMMSFAVAGQIVLAQALADRLAHRR